MKKTLLVATLLLAVGGGAGPHPAAAPALAQANPGAEPVAIEFFAVAPDGSAITDLKSAELALKVSGRLRTIRGVQWTSTLPRVAPDTKPVAPAPAPFDTNVLSTDGRAVVVVLDDESFTPGREQPLRDAIGSFLKALSVTDRVALVNVPYGGLKVDFTTEHERIALAMLRIGGQAAVDQTGSDLACRTRRTLESVAGLLNSLAGGKGPTTVVFVSGAMAAPRRDAVSTLAPGPCEITTDHFAQVAIAASAARAHFYVVLPEDVVTRNIRPVENISGRGFIGSDNPIAGIEHLAGVTGGQQFPLLSSRETNLARIARETAGYYLVTFDPEPGERNGNRHTVDLRTTRDGVTIRVRPNITIARLAPRSTRSRVSPRDMLRDAAVFRDLPLRSMGFVAADEIGEKNLKVLVMAEAVDQGVTLTAAAAGLFDRTGRLVQQWTANAEDLAAPSLITAFVVAPGTYRLRVAGTDASGRAGSADSEVLVELVPLGALRVSGLVLGLAREGGFRPRMQFRQEPVAIGYLEVYGDPGDTPIKVTIDVAVTPNGPPIVTIPAAVQVSNDRRRRTVSAAIPVGAMPPGDVVVRANLTTQSDTARVSRTLRKIP